MLQRISLADSYKNGGHLLGKNEFKNHVPVMPIILPGQDAEFVKELTGHYQIMR